VGNPIPFVIVYLCICTKSNKDKLSKMSENKLRIFNFFEFNNPAHSKAKITCGKEKCKKEFSKYPQFHNWSQSVQKTHIDDEHTCGYCLDPKIFETSEDRKSHQSSCKAFILLKRKGQLVNGASQKTRREKLLEYLENNIYIYSMPDKPPQLLLLQKKNPKNTIYSYLFDGTPITLSNQVEVIRLTINNIPSAIF
jgi:hypothetical protein